MFPGQSSDRPKSAASASSAGGPATTAPRRSLSGTSYAAANAAKGPAASKATSAASPSPSPSPARGGVGGAGAPPPTPDARLQQALVARLYAAGGVPPSAAAKGSAAAMASSAQTVRAVFGTDAPAPQQHLAREAPVSAADANRRGFLACLVPSAPPVHNIREALNTRRPTSAVGRAAPCGSASTAGSAYPTAGAEDDHHHPRAATPSMPMLFGAADVTDADARHHVDAILAAIPAGPLPTDACISAAMVRAMLNDLQALRAAGELGLPVDAPDDARSPFAFLLQRVLGDGPGPQRGARRFEYLQMRLYGRSVDQQRVYDPYYLELVDRPPSPTADRRPPGAGDTADDLRRRHRDAMIAIHGRQRSVHRRYFTVSAAGIVSIDNGDRFEYVRPDGEAGGPPPLDAPPAGTAHGAIDVQYTPFAAWLREYNIFRRLHTLSFFKHARVSKFFAVWRGATLASAMRHAAERLHRNLFLLDPDVYRALVALRKLSAVLEEGRQADAADTTAGRGSFSHETNAVLDSVTHRRPTIPTSADATVTDPSRSLHQRAFTFIPQRFALQQKRLSEAAAVADAFRGAQRASRLIHPTPPQRPSTQQTAATSAALFRKRNSRGEHPPTNQEAPVAEAAAFLDEFLAFHRGPVASAMAAHQEEALQLVENACADLQRNALANDPDLQLPDCSSHIAVARKKHAAERSVALRRMCDFQFCRAIVVNAIANVRSFVAVLRDAATRSSMDQRHGSDGGDGDLEGPRRRRTHWEDVKMHTATPFYSQSALVVVHVRLLPGEDGADESMLAETQRVVDDDEMEAGGSRRVSGVRGRTLSVDYRTAVAFEPSAISVSATMDRIVASIVNTSATVPSFFDGLRSGLPEEAGSVAGEASEVAAAIAISQGVERRRCLVQAHPDYRPALDEVHANVRRTFEGVTARCKPLRRWTAVFDDMEGLTEEAALRDDRSAQWFRGMADTIRAHLTDIDHIEDHVRVGFVELDFTPFKETMTTALRGAMTRIAAALPVVARNRNTRFFQDVSGRYAVMATEPTEEPLEAVTAARQQEWALRRADCDPVETAAVDALLGGVLPTIDRLHQSHRFAKSLLRHYDHCARVSYDCDVIYEAFHSICQLFKANEDPDLAQGHVDDESSKDAIDALNTGTATIVKRIRERSALFDHGRDRYAKRIQEQLAAATVLVSGGCRDVMRLCKESTAFHNTDALADPSLLATNVAALGALVGMAQELEGHCAEDAKMHAALEVDFQRPPEVRECLATTRASLRLWQLAAQWDAYRAELLPALLRQLPSTVNTDADAFVGAVQQCSRHSGQSPVFRALRESVELVRSALGVVEVLRCPHLQAPHWRDINRLVEDHLRRRFTEQFLSSAAEVALHQRHSVLSSKSSIISSRHGLGSSTLSGGPQPGSPRQRPLETSGSAATAASTALASALSAALATQTFAVTLDQLQISTDYIIQNELVALIEPLQAIAFAASQEAMIDRTLSDTAALWQGGPSHPTPVALTIVPFKDRRDQHILAADVDDVLLLLEESHMRVSSVLSNRLCEGPLKTRATRLLTQVQVMDLSVRAWVECQQLWMYLEGVFSQADISRQWPADDKAFKAIDKAFRDMMRRVRTVPAVFHNCHRQSLGFLLKSIRTLDRLHASLAKRIDQKRRRFPRLYFISNEDVLDVLAQVRTPERASRHLSKMFDGVSHFRMTRAAIAPTTAGRQPKGTGSAVEGAATSQAAEITAVLSPEGVLLPLIAPVRARGDVEMWLKRLERSIATSLAADVAAAWMMRADPAAVQTGVAWRLMSATPEQVASLKAKADEEVAASTGLPPHAIVRQPAPPSAAPSLSTPTSKDPLAVLREVAAHNAGMCFLPQVVQLVEWGAWCLMCEAAITDLNRPKRMYELQAYVNATIRRLARVASAPTTAAASAASGGTGPVLDAAVTRTLVASLLSQLVYQRDLTDRLAASASVTSTSDFEWSRILKVHIDTVDSNMYASLMGRTVRPPSDDTSAPTVHVACHQLGAELSYGFEFLGSQARLVITPVTDLVYLTITSALRMGYGAAPAGPAGTGKTETVKDLARVLARPCIVFNCSDGVTYRMLEQLLRGVMPIGAWACLDEFNRIHVEVLSAIASQLLELKAARDAQLETFPFQGMEPVLLNPACGVFVTMNPGYAGRTELPDNLKNLFRPVAVTAPDTCRIAEVSLFSAGYATATTLAPHLTGILALCATQLSRCAHYDFGMRLLKSILRVAETLRRAHGQGCSKLDEMRLVIRALDLCTAPRLLDDDVVLFDQLRRDFFGAEARSLVERHDGASSGGTSEAESVATHLREHLADRSADMVLHDGQLTKAVQLFETLQLRFGVVILGPAGCGKTVVTNLLADGYAAPLAPGMARRPVTRLYRLNPKAVSYAHLFGSMNVVTGEWTDGILVRTCREIVEEEAAVAADESSPPHDGHGHTAAPPKGAVGGERRYWVVFDGPVDTKWIESLNSVLDDSRLLCLDNGVRYRLPDPEMRMLFEVCDLSHASPATVSRCGMVCVPENARPVDAALTLWLQEVHAALGPMAGEYLHAATTRLFRRALNDFSAFCEAASSVAAAPGEDQASLDAHAGGGGGGSPSGYRLCRSYPQPESRVYETFVSVAKLYLRDWRRDDITEEGRPLSATDVALQAAKAGLHRGPAAPHRPSVVPNNKAPDPMPWCCMLDVIVAYAMTVAIGGDLSDLESDWFDTYVRQLTDAAASADHGPSLGLPAGAAAAFPPQGTVYDYRPPPYADSRAGWLPLASLIPPFTFRGRFSGGAVGQHLLATQASDHVPNIGTILVPTLETTRCMDLVTALLRNRVPVLLTGPSGVGKSVILSSVLGTLRDDQTGGGTVTVSTQFTFSTPAARLADLIDGRLVPVRGRRDVIGAPIPGHRICLLVDDANMPQPDVFGACPVHELLRQMVGDGGLYDRQRLVFRRIDDMVTAACCGERGDGRPTMSPRLTRLFVSVRQREPSEHSLNKILSALYEGFFGVYSPTAKRPVGGAAAAAALADTVFSPEVRQMRKGAVAALIDLYSTARQLFRPLPHSPHYAFSCRDLTRVFQGLLRATPAKVPTGRALAHLWLHEAQRVFADRLCNDMDRSQLGEVVDSVMKRHSLRVSGQGSVVTAAPTEDFARGAGESIGKATPVFWSVMAGGELCPYDRYANTAELVEGVAHAVATASANATAAQIGALEPSALVLLPFCCAQVCKAARVLGEPRGSAVIIGAPGSGKRVVARLAAFVLGYTMIEAVPTERKTFHDFAAQAYIAAGTGTAPAAALLVSDADFCGDAFLEDLSSIVNFLEIPGMFSDEHRELIFSRTVDGYSAARATSGRQEATMARLQEEERRATEEDELFIAGDGPAGGVMSMPEDDGHTALAVVANTSFVVPAHAGLEASQGPSKEMAADGESAPAAAPNRDDVHQHFLEQVAQRLHVVICLSADHLTLQRRCRQFPSIISGCTVLWMREWPADALRTLAVRQLGPLVDAASSGEAAVLTSQKSSASSTLPSQLQFGLTAVAEAAVGVHEIAARLAPTANFSLISPGTFIQYTKLCAKMVGAKREELAARRRKLAQGVDRMELTLAAVAEMEAQVRAMEPKIAEETEQITQLTEVVKEQSTAAQAVAAQVEEQRWKAHDQEKEARLLQEDAQKELSQAMPEWDKARKALSSLQKQDIDEMKKYSKPPQAVQTTMEAVLVLLGEKKVDWASARIALGNQKFIDRLLLLRIDDMDVTRIERVQKYVRDREFVPDVVGTSGSEACRSLCQWARAVEHYYHVNKRIEPKFALMRQAEAEVAMARAVLEEARKELLASQKKCNELTETLTNAHRRRKALEEGRAVLARRLEAAGILTTSLADEKRGWEAGVQRATEGARAAVLESLARAALVVYGAPMSASARAQLSSQIAARIGASGARVLLEPPSPFFSPEEVGRAPLDESSFSLASSVDANVLRQWCLRGLPRDENAASLSAACRLMLAHGTRWPLLVDPQRQLLPWIHQADEFTGVEVSDGSDMDDDTSSEDDTAGSAAHSSPTPSSFGPRSAAASPHQSTLRTDSNVAPRDRPPSAGGRRGTVLSFRPPRAPRGGAGDATTAPHHHASRSAQERPPHADRPSAVVALAVDHPKLVPQLRQLVPRGATVVLTGVLGYDGALETNIPTSINALLARRVHTVGGRMLMEIGDETVDYNPCFQLLLVCTEPRPLLLATVLNRVVPFDCLVTKRALEGQVLGAVVSVLEAPLQKAQDRLLRRVAFLKRRVLQTEDEMLALLSSADGNILDNNALIVRLHASKRLSDATAAKAEASEHKGQALEARRDAYRPVARTVSALYIAAAATVRTNALQLFSLEHVVHRLSLPEVTAWAAEHRRTTAAATAALAESDNGAKNSSASSPPAADRSSSPPLNSASAAGEDVVLLGPTETDAISERVLRCGLRSILRGLRADDRLLFATHLSAELYHPVTSSHPVDGDVVRGILRLRCTPAAAGLSDRLDTATAVEPALQRFAPTSIATDLMEALCTEADTDMDAAVAALPPAVKRHHRALVTALEACEGLGDFAARAFGPSAPVPVPPSLLRLLASAGGLSTGAEWARLSRRQQWAQVCVCSEAIQLLESVHTVDPEAARLLREGAVPDDICAAAVPGGIEQLLLSALIAPHRFEAAASAFCRATLGATLEGMTLTEASDNSTGILDAAEASGPHRPMLVSVPPGADPTDAIDDAFAVLQRRFEASAQDLLSLNSANPLVEAPNASHRQLLKVSLGQGQEEAALAGVVSAVQSGHWVAMLNGQLSRTTLGALSCLLAAVAQRPLRVPPPPPSSTESPEPEAASEWGEYESNASEPASPVHTAPTSRPVSARSRHNARGTADTGPYPPDRVPTSAVADLLDPGKVLHRAFRDLYVDGIDTSEAVAKRNDGSASSGESDEDALEREEGGTETIGRVWTRFHRRQTKRQRPNAASIAAPFIAQLPPDVHPAFRCLLCVAEGCGWVPLPLLESSEKVAFVAAGDNAGGAASQDAFLSESIAGASSSSSACDFGPLFTALALFSTALRERRARYGAGDSGSPHGIGWNNTYAFSGADLAFAQVLLRDELAQAMAQGASADRCGVMAQFIVCELIFGGRVTDPRDAELLRATYRRFVDPVVRFLSSGRVEQGLTEYVRELRMPPADRTHPLTHCQGAAFFGLHASADDAYTGTRSTALLAAVASSLGSLTSAGGGPSADLGPHLPDAAATHRLMEAVEGTLLPLLAADDTTLARLSARQEQARIDAVWTLARVGADVPAPQVVPRRDPLSACLLAEAVHIEHVWATVNGHLRAASEHLRETLEVQANHEAEDAELALAVAQASKQRTKRGGGGAQATAPSGSAAKVAVSPADMAKLLGHIQRGEVPWCWSAGCEAGPVRFHASGVPALPTEGGGIVRWLADLRRRSCHIAAWYARHVAAFDAALLRIKSSAAGRGDGGHPVVAPSPHPPVLDVSALHHPAALLAAVRQRFARSVSGSGPSSSPHVSLGDVSLRAVVTLPSNEGTSSSSPAVLGGGGGVLSPPAEGAIRLCGLKAAGFVVPDGALGASLGVSGRLADGPLITLVPTRTASAAGARGVTTGTPDATPDAAGQSVVPIRVPLYQTADRAGPGNFIANIAVPVLASDSSAEPAQLLWDLARAAFVCYGRVPDV